MAKDQEIEEEIWMDEDDRMAMFDHYCNVDHLFERDYFVGIKHRPRKPDVHNDVSINTPYYFDMKERLARYDKYEADHAETLKSFDDKDRKFRFMWDRYELDKCYPYLYDHRQFDLPLDLMLYIYCVDHDIDLEFKPNKDASFTNFNDVVCHFSPDYRVGDKYVCIRPSYWYDEKGKAKSPYPMWWFICPNPFDDKSRDEVNSDFEKQVEAGKKAGFEYWDENGKEFEKINQWIYDNYSDDYVPLFILGVPFPWPNEDLRDTSPMGLVRHFHKSIFEARHGHEPTALELWDNKDIFKKVALNRLLFVGECSPKRILSGFNIAKTATKVSVFKSSLADRLIKQYLWDAKEIFDPFSGFSGRMLGAFINHIPYIGSDMSTKHIEESKQIAEWWSKNKYPVQYCLNVADVCSIFGVHDCLFTCSPYATVDKSGKRENIEDWNNKNQQVYTCDEWIDICFCNFRCRKYLFVVDDTIQKYRPWVVGTIANTGHMGRNNELILFFDFTNYNDGFVTPNGSKGFTPFDRIDEDGYAEPMGQGVTPYGI